MQTYFREVRHGNFVLIRGDMVSNCINRWGEWSETEVELFASILTPQSNVIEVGSHIGSHTIPLSRLCSEGSVYAYEAQRKIHYVLNANIVINNCQNVVSSLLAVTDRDGILKLPTTDYEQQWNYGNFSIVSGFDDEDRFTGPIGYDYINAGCLDHDPHLAQLKEIDLLKIDAEGVELSVLKGAGRLIARHKPAIYVEATREESNRTIFGDLKARGYSGYWFATVRARPDSYFGPADYEDGAAAMMDVNAIFFHRDNPRDVFGLTQIQDEFTPPQKLPVLVSYPSPAGAPMFIYGR